MSPVDPAPKTEYIRNGDIYLAYQVYGDGPNTILFVGGFLSHLELLWEEPELAKFLRRLGKIARVIIFDKRGVGLSDRVGSAPTAEETIEDMLVILNAVGSDQVCLLSVSEGGPIAILFAATYPKRTSHIILYGTMPKWVRSYDYPWALARSQYDQWLDEMINNWGTAVSLHTFAPSRAADANFQAWWSKMLRLSATPGSVRDVLGALREMDVRSVLPHVRVPALVLHRTGDKAVPLAGSRYLAQQLPNAHFVELSGKDHWWWVGDGEAILHEVDVFLAKTDDVPTSNMQLVESLTNREMDVLRLIAAGYTNQQIADELILALGTVKTYSSNIFGKLNVMNRTQAIAAARKQGLLR